jgi:outer membrane protein TolC
MNKNLAGISLFLLIFPLLPHSIRAQELVLHSAAEAAEFAVQNSPLWTIGRQRALLDMKTAKLGIQDFLPSFSFALSHSDSTTMLAGDSRSKSLRLSVSQEIFDGGKKRLSYEAGRISALYSWQEFEGERQNFLSTIMTLYYQYTLQQEMGEIRENLLNQAGEQLSILKREMELGLTLETDYLEFAASYMDIEQERDQGLRDLGSLERQLKNALNLSQEAPIKIIPPIPEEQKYFYYEPYFDYLWALVRNTSVALKKQQLNAEYRVNQYNYSKRWYLPVISAQGSVSFSGDDYPLTEPAYSLQLTFDFSSLEFLSLRLSNGSGFERQRLQQLSNGLSGDLRPLPAYPTNHKLGELEFLESTLRQGEEERELKENLYEIVITYDNKLRAAYSAEQRIALMEKRLAFSLLQLEKGEKRRIDYLEELSSLAQIKISRADYLAQASAMERNLEIQTGFPFGGLADVCRNH